MEFGFWNYQCHASACYYVIKTTIITPKSDSFFMATKFPNNLLSLKNLKTLVVQTINHTVSFTKAACFFSSLVSNNLWASLRLLLTNV